MVGATSVDNAKLLVSFARLTNVLLLLQSLDKNANPDNGTDLTGIDGQIDASTVDLTLSTKAFIKGGYGALINRRGSICVAPKRAVSHLLASLGESLTVSLRSSQTQDFDGDGITDRTTTFEYNELDQFTTINAESGTLTTLTCHSAGLLASITD